jgi:hypothetical protein
MICLEKFPFVSMAA